MYYALRLLWRPGKIMRAAKVRRFSPLLERKEIHGAIAQRNSETTAGARLPCRRRRVGRVVLAPVASQGKRGSFSFLRLARRTHGGMETDWRTMADCRW